MAVLGTGSDVGKSVVVAALCRIFSDLGLRVTPFKAQNMSNNSYVTRSGAEMGRAQVVQAEAARLEPDVDMNPVLLKPCTDTGAQVVLHGKAIGNRKAKDYFADTDYLLEEARASLERLRSRHELVIMEGAGSCAEVNLFRSDFVNFRIARAVDAPVILVADIDRGGVFAQIVGTLEVLPREDRERIHGVIINRFRGDPALFDEGIKYLEERTRVPVLGLVPFFRHIEIDSEDGLPLETIIDPPQGPGENAVNVAVLRLPHISNFTDFSPLARAPGVILHYLAKPRPLDGYNLVLLPGTKNVRGDLGWLRETGWTRLLADYVKKGGELGGMCGGYQMLGRMIRDPQGIEGTAGETPGICLLDVETELQGHKILARSSGVWDANGELVEGYEIHMGLTSRPRGLAGAIQVRSRNDVTVREYDGARTSDGKVWGTYFHGLFDQPGFRHAFLKHLKPDYQSEGCKETSETISAFRDRQYDLLAHHFRSHLRMSKLFDLMGFRPETPSAVSP